MHTVTRTNPVWFAAAAGLTGMVLASSSANATLVAADSFLDGGSAPVLANGEYQTDGFGGLGSTIRLQDPTVAGFVNPWGGTSNTGIGWYSTGNVLARATGLDLGYGFEQPGAVNWLNAPEDFLIRFIQRDLDTAAIAPTSTWYMSAIVNPGSNSTSGARTGFTYAGFTNDLTDGRLYRDPSEDPGNIGNLFGAVVGFEWDGAEMDLVLRHRQDTGGGDVKPASNVMIDGVLDNTSYAVFMKIDAVAGGVDNIKYWVNPTGNTEAEFDISNIATGTLPSFGFNSDAGSWNALDLDMNRAVISTQNWNGSMSIDELRLATTFEDIRGLSGPALDGDLNGDGFVGIGDLNIVLGNWNQNVASGDPTVGDPSGDGFVGIEDLNTVLGNWNAGTPPSAAAVPEPTTLALLGLGGIAMLKRRR